MKKIFSFTKKKKYPSGTPDNGSVLSVGYDLKDKDLGKVHKAASGGDLVKLKQLAKKSDINQLDKENRTALHIACASGHVEVVQFLVESKAKLNLCDNQNRSALMKAVQGQHERCVNILLENHAEPNLVDINGNTALHLAANIPSVSTAGLLLEHEADINAPNKEGFTPLSVAVREDHIEMAEFLLKEGADVNFTGQEERSPLMIAAGNGQIGMLRLLLRFDADITLKDAKGWSADDYAVMNGHHPCSLLIIEHGTQKNDGSSLLHQDVGKKKKKMLLGSPSQDAEAGFSLGGPATDKDDFEDNSQSESLSRVSKSAADEWPSSDNDDESVSIEKKPLKVNLRKMIASKKGEASAQPDRSLSGVESEPESENIVQRIPSFPKVSPSSNALQHPVDPYPVSFLSKTPQMTSTPLPSYRKVQFSVKLYQLHFYNTFLSSSKIHKQADYGAEQKKSKHSEQPSTSKAKSEGHPDAENSEEEGEEEEEEEEEEDEEDDEEDEEDDDDDEDEEDDDEEEEDEEEEEEDEDEEDEDEEEKECEDDNDKCVASVESAGFEDVQKPSLTDALKIVDSADAPTTVSTDIANNNASSSSHVVVDENLDASENAAKTETQPDDSAHPAETSDYAIPVTLGIEDDCIVSAIRVESKFSDEDDSLGKECMSTSNQNVMSDRGSAAGPKTSKYQTETLSPNDAKEEESEKEKEKDDDDDDDDSWSNKQDTGETVWNDSDDEGNQTGAFGRNTVLAKRRNIAPEHDHSDAEDKSDEEVEKQRRSSWGSSLDSDTDLANDDKVNKKTLEQKSDLKASDVQPEATTQLSEDTSLQPNEDHPHTSWDTPKLSSSKCVSPQHVIDKRMSPLKLSTASSPQSIKTPAKTAADESDWDSSSENHDSGSPTKNEAPSPVSGKDAANVTREPQCSDASFNKKDEDCIKKLNDPSPTVSPANEDENTSRNQKLQDSQNQKDGDSSWDDDEDDSNQEYMPNSPSQNKGQSSPHSFLEHKTAVDLSKTHEIEGDKDSEKIPLSVHDVNDDFPEGRGLEEEKPLSVKKACPSKDDETSEDSDSMDQKLQYDFASATVKVSDVEDDYVCKGDSLEDHREARLISYIPLQTKSAVVPETTASVDKLREVSVMEKIFSSSLTKDDGTAGQQTDSDGNAFSDEALPQTDIDDVDIDSPDESLGMNCPEISNTEEYPNQKDDSTEDEDDQNDEKENKDDEEEEDISDDDEQPEESGDSRDDISPIPEGEASKDKKRDFLSELGLDRGEGEQESWDSESESENPNLPHEENQSVLAQDQEDMTTVKEENKEREGSSRMAVLEPRRSVDRPKSSQGEAINSSKADNGDEDVNKDDTTQKETEKAKWKPLLSKLEGGTDRKTDLMEELGLGDVDDLEDASDWDSASTTSKRTLPGRRIASPGIEEFPECSNSPIKEQEEGVFPTAPLTPQRSINSDRRLLTTPSHTAPHPQPRARKMVLQKPGSQEDSDWDSDDLMSPCKTEKTDSNLQEIVNQQAEVRPDSPELTQMARGRECHVEAEEQQQKEGDDTVALNQLDVDDPSPSGHASPDNDERDNELRDTQSPEERGEVGAGVPWEKRYEKLWVEVEKREVKSTFKNVAGELKARFGELFKSNRSNAGDTDEEQDKAECSSVEEESSDEEEGEVIVRPTARARSTVLLTIPEQRESGLEDSVTESADHSLCEDGMEVCAAPGSESSMCREPEILTDDVLEECRSSSPQPPMEDDNIDHATTAFTDDHTIPVSDVDHCSFLEDDSTLAPFSKQRLDHNLKNNPDNLDEAELKNNSVSSEEDPDESHPTSLGRPSASVPGVSDEELEEDMERFKLEVGMLKVVFLDLEKEKAQLQKEVGKGPAKTALEVQKSSTSWDTGGTALEDVGAEKPETMLGCRKEMSSQTTLQEQQPVATKSTNGAPVQLQLPLQQTYNKNNQDVQAVEETIQLELVRGARRSRAPQTNTHINGDPLSVFDDSSLSEVSDDEGRMPTEVKQKNESPEEVDMAEDFDELTQSSDTATDDLDSPTAGYRHASLLIQKLDSATLDSRSMVKLQNIFHEYERSIQKVKSRHGYLADKVSQLEMERVELKSSLDEVKDVKSALERNQLELQTEVTNLKFQLKQEQENRRNATMMYNTTKDKLKRTEEQQQFEVQERQKVELTLRNLELEMRTLVNNMKQLEEDHSETQRLLAQERSARTLQENLLSSHLRKQQEIEEESKRNISKSNEALTQLTEASDRERELLQQTATLQEQLTILRTDMERSQASSSLKESHLLEENEALKEQLEDVRRDLKLNSEALTQTVFNCNNQLTGLKSELTKTTTLLENERQSRETLEAEVASTRTRLAGAIQEAERCLAAHADTEKALLREKEENQRLKDRLTGEAVSQRDTVSSLSQKLSKAEVHVNSMENEVHRVTLQLTEKGLLLDVLQREKDQAAARVKELETALQTEKELVSRGGARHEATQERLAQAQSEVMLLRQQLEEAQNKGDAKERAVTDAQERFSDILSKLRSDCEERVQLVEERNKELASKAADLRDQIYKLEEEKNERETSLRQLQQELADSLKKLSMSEASLEVNTRYRNDLEEEKGRFLKDMDRLKGKLEESEDQYVQAEKRINTMKSSLDEREKELTTAAHKLQEALSASAASDTTIKQLEDAMQRLEIENARLEAAAKQQFNKIDALQKGAQEAAMVRGHLEDLVTNLQSSKMTLEDQLSREVQKQSMLSHTAQDSQALWEEELKSRSKLGLRLAELEKEKGELTSQMEIEKKKAKKIGEQKKAVDARLEQEMNRNTDLQKEMYRLRTLLKTAKKKLRDQDMGGAEFASPMSSLRMDLGRYSQAEGRMKEKVDDLQTQLEKESSRRSQLEKANDELKDQLSSMKRLNHSSEQLERSKQQLEEELLDLRRKLEAAQVEHSQVDLFRRDAEERARQEIQQKLEQVNLFLQTQAASQEALDQIKAANEANLRSQLEHKIRELENDLGRARTTQQDSFSQRESTRTELERYRQLYAEELRLRKSLASKLERSNSRLSEANSKLLSERSKSLIASSFANGSLGGPSLDGSSLGPLNRSLGLGLSLLNPVSEGQSNRVEDYLAKMQSELDRNISKELSNATAELDVASTRMSPVGSATRVELDPLSRAKQQYLEVLKKNHKI